MNKLRRECLGVCWLFLLVGVGAVWAQSSTRTPEFLIADFERADYGNWSATGDAFGAAPARGALPGQQAVSGFLGKGLVNTFLNKDRSTGTLTSPSFTIERRYINFLIGGGRHPGKTCINLILADGRIVHTSTGPNNERLQKTTWDVSEFIGQTVTLQIVDSEKESWGHISIDHIHQSRTPWAANSQKPWVNMPLIDFTLSIKITGNYLNLPVDDSMQRCFMTLKQAQDKPVTGFTISLAEKEPVFWASIDVRDYKGQTLTYVIDQIIKDHPALKMIHQTDTIPLLDSLYNRPYRPQFHYSPRVGWVNDPNGLLYYNGVYHFFYQYNAYGMKWSNMRWGYATSTDLVHWTEYGIAFELPPGLLAFSGGGVVDWKNTTGLQKGKHPPLLLYLTVPDNGQFLVYSVDGGTDWIVYDKNPVTTIMNRDPKVFWYPASPKGSAVTSEPGGHWVMTLFSGNYNGTFHFSTSTNGLDWTPHTTNVFPGHNECPDMFEMAVEGNPSDKKWVFLSGAGNHKRGDCAKYSVGTFDGVTFTPVQDSIRIDSGKGSYSTQVFSDAPNGRKIFMSWFSRLFGSVGLPGMPSNAQFRVPWELTLYQEPGGLYRLRRWPVRELDILRGKKHHWQDVSVSPETPLKTDIEKRELDIDVTIRPGRSGSFSFHLAGLEIQYDCNTRTLKGFEKTVELRPINGELPFRILVDRTSVELFAHNGAVAMSGFWPTDYEKEVLTVISTQGTHRITTLDVHEMKSIWEEAVSDSQ